jgi:hypothetical protein
MSSRNPGAVQSGPATSAAGGPPSGGGTLGLWATAAIVVSGAVMIAASLLRGSWMTPPLPMPVTGPPWELSAHVSAEAIVVAIWLAAGLGGAGVMAGLVAVRRGARLPIRALLLAAAIAMAALVVLPPAGSTDALDYAVYGHIAALGHSPYVMTPAQFRQLRDLPGIPLDWASRRSVYGPLATAVQFAAARLGPASLAATVFWLKLANAIAFGAVGLAADRLLRDDPASRLRAHLLWTANPLLLWTVIAAGHLDVLAAAAGLAGLLILERWSSATPLVRAVAAGVAVGAAADIKASYALFGLAVAWSLRREPGQLAAAAVGAIAILVPSFLLAGPPALKAVLGAPGGQGIYAEVIGHIGVLSGHVLPLAGFLVVAAVLLALWRIPPGFGGQTPIRAALAISLGWLLVWPEQYAWYDVMIVCVLVFYPASRLDWLVLTWLTASTITDMPGRGLGGAADALGTVLPALHTASHTLLAPLVVAAALAALVTLCVTGRWNARAQATLPR